MARLIPGAAPEVRVSLSSLADSLDAKQRSWLGMQEPRLVTLLEVHTPVLCLNFALRTRWPRGISSLRLQETNVVSVAAMSEGFEIFLEYGTMSCGR